MLSEQDATLDEQDGLPASFYQPLDKFEFVPELFTHTQGLAARSRRRTETFTGFASQPLKNSNRLRANSLSIPSNSLSSAFGPSLFASDWDPQPDNLFTLQKPFEDSTDQISILIKLLTLVERTLDYLGLDENPPESRTSIFNKDAKPFLATDQSQFPLRDLMQPLSGRGTQNMESMIPSYESQRIGSPQGDIMPPRPIIHSPVEKNANIRNSPQLQQPQKPGQQFQLGENRPRSMSLSYPYETSQNPSENLSIKIPTSLMSGSLAYTRQSISVFNEGKSSIPRIPSPEEDIRWEEMVIKEFIKYRITMTKQRDLIPQMIASRHPDLCG